MTRTLRTVAFWIVAALLVAAHGIVLWQSISATRLWEDEAFNLTVPVNLLQGLGYTSDGTLSGSELTPFDARISTGPVVLLPIAAVLATGVDLVVGGRLVPAAYFVALLVAVGILGRRIGGRWGALVAVAVPLAFTAAALPSPIQGPADVLGEVPAAALLAWALVALRTRPWLAGLLVGLAIQAKYIALLSLPAFVVAVLLLQHGRPWMRRLRALIAPAIALAVPTVLVEIFAFISLGPRGFVDHLRATRDFIRSGGQVAHTTFGEKLTTLASSWYLPAAVVVAAVVLAIVVLIAGLVLRYRPSTDRFWATLAAEPRAHLAAAAVLGFGAFVGWWSTAGHLPLWVRHPAPGILAFAPVLVAALIPAVRQLWRSGAAARAASVVVSAALAGCLVVSGSSAGVTAAGRDGTELAAQREQAAAVASVEADWIATHWGGLVAVVVMSGAHVALLDAPPENIAGYPRLDLGGADLCGAAAPLAEAPGIVVCPAG
ncbi:hypothetical protein CBF90_14325 [Microbacterium sp. AISO3]|uniref:Glycosyltransferase RgtA/B/C/D-like domain-containing protein n=1 Tax=Microbacterium arborescens TaxID=33883 RepID=A0ABX2WLD5_9MICO|nr:MULTISPECIES: glycosyltransferase 87 family protein [Microbacterium]OAZ44254.1 hypothetical protein A9Z40_12740 [Microbacterium arborescens]OWP20243.1 hypothetical protein CBF90_17860 [Microbacterium sp. AISO3]OWP20891.1 hypothetical protein CBF90_14325 [Microbacterium sp. AISO3]QCR41353.1 DUF2029 domain-containing protein [Microbacterium sp. SGAir0570]